jgi:hypothetical protein
MSTVELNAPARIDSGAPDRVDTLARLLAVA